MIAASEPSSGIRSCQYGIHLDSCEVGNQAVVSTFGRDCQDTIHEAQVGGVSNGNDSEEGADGAEAGVSGTDLVLTFRFEMIQEGQDGRCIQISDGQCGR